LAATVDCKRRIIVAGAGISGLSCAYYLQQCGLPVLVLEASSRAGGLISTTSRNGFLFESGPQSPRFSERLRKMISELGLDGEFVPADPNLNRYIVKKGQLHKAPFSPGSLLTTDLVGLKSKLRITKKQSQSSSIENLDRRFWTIWLIRSSQLFSSATRE
jgi:protoporphyrinogen/coproporphyrinogen III oxidase